MDFCGTLTCDLQLSMPIDALPSEPRSPYGMAGMATSLSLDGLMQTATKQEAVSLDGRRRLQKPSIGTYRQGLAAVVHSTLSLPK